MSFNPPQTTPSFNPNREQEDSHWRQHAVRSQAGPSNSSSSSSRMTSSYSYPHSHASSSTAPPLYPPQAPNGSLNAANLKDRLSNLLGSQSNRDLPMYKDKPHFPLRRSRLFNAVFPRGRRKRWGVLGLVMFLLIWWSGLFSSADTEIDNISGSKKESWWSWFNKQDVNWNYRRAMVKQAFVTSWEDYRKHAWGMDEYSPISKNGKMIARPLDPFGSNEGVGGVGWIIVDALDTAIIMNLTTQVTQAREWIATSLDFSRVNGEVSTFETTIRVLGGLLSAHYLSTNFPHLAPIKDDDVGEIGEDLYIEKAVDLADRLLGAFETNSGIPLTGINLNTSRGVPSRDMGGISSTSEATTLQLELKYLAKITGEPLYWEKAEQIMKVVDAQQMEAGLLPIFINPDNGRFFGNTIRLGSRGDSYYEYLVKQYLQTGEHEKVYQDMWEEAWSGIKKYLITFSHHSNFTVLGERDNGLSGGLSGKMDHLVCFMPGTIALSVTGGETVSKAKKRLGAFWGKKQEDDLLLAEELMKTCWGTYAVTPTGLAPEITYMIIDDPARKYNPNDDPKWRQPTSTVDFEHDDYLHHSLASWRKDFDIRPLDVHNLQRPETVESLYYMYRITGNPKYREWGWQMFQSFLEHTKVIDYWSSKLTGYTSIESVLDVPSHKDKTSYHSITKNAKLNSKHKTSNNLADVEAGKNADVDAPAIPHGDPDTDPNTPTMLVGNRQITSFTRLSRDNLEGFWLAETLKYFYLLFSDAPDSDLVSSSKSGDRKERNVIHDEWFDLTKTVINTEAHIFPRFDIKGSKVFKTGWERQIKKVDSDLDGYDEDVDGGKHRAKSVKLEDMPAGGAIGNMGDS